MNPLVSVVVVTYQHADYIKQCLESILMQQTNFDVEIILGEDESTDGTREICIEYSIKYPDKIRLFLRSKHDKIFIIGDPSGRFNFLASLREAKGKYIAFCDGDDYWTDIHKLQKQVDFLQEHPDYSGCFHFTQQINEDGIPGKIHGDHNHKLDFTAGDTFSTTSLFHTSSFLFRSDALTIPAWFDKIVGGDMAVFSIVSANGKLRCIPEIMSVYRKHAGGLTNSSIATFQNHHRNRIALMNYLNEYHDYKFDKKVKTLVRYHQNNLDGKRTGSLYASLKNAIKKILHQVK